AKAAETKRGDHRPAAEALVLLSCFGVERSGCVQECVELVDLEECSRRLGTREEAARATADAHRVACYQLVVHGLLQDLSEQSDHRVDRGVRERPPSALVGAALAVRD